MPQAIQLFIRLLSFAIAIYGFAIVAPLLADSNRQTRYQKLLAEVRCLSCRNAALADATTAEARDQRREVLDLVDAGYSDEDIRDYLGSRYGARVLYRPRNDKESLFLLIAPIVVQVGGGLVCIILLYRYGES